MNQLVGKILSLKQSEGIAFVKVEGNGFCLGVMTLGNDLKEGERVRACFKDSDVMIAHKSSGKLSARNKFLSLVRHISHDEVLARVEFEFNATAIASLISYEALKELEIKEGEEFFWFVKSNEIILESLER